MSEKKSNKKIISMLDRAMKDPLYFFNKFVKLKNDMGFHKIKLRAYQKDFLRRHGNKNTQ